MEGRSKHYDGSMSLRILAFSGSLREKSFNKKLLQIAVEAARSAGAEVEVLDLRDFEAPIYDGDREEREGIPPKILEFTELVHAADGLLISCPEHNGAVTAALKNTLDWASRDRKGPEEKFCFDGKLVGLLGATPGRLGAARGLANLEVILKNIGATVIETQMGLAKAHDAFDENGHLRDSEQDQQTQQLGIDLVRALEEALAQPE